MTYLSKIEMGSYKAKCALYFWSTLFGLPEIGLEAIFATLEHLGSEFNFNQLATRSAFISLLVALHM